MFLCVKPHIRPRSTWQHPKLLNQVRNAIRRKHYSYRTEQAHLGWIKRYLHFHKIDQDEFRHPAELGATEIETFLIPP